MKYFNKVTIFFIAMWLILWIYSFLAEHLPIYFFWESGFICWTFFLLALSSLAYSISNKTQNTIISNIFKILVLVLIAPIIFKYIFLFSLKSSKPFEQLKKEIFVNEKLVNQIGEIDEISVIPRGSYGYKKNSNGTFGRANLNVILKGKNEYKKIQALVTKEIDSSGWNVINIEY